MLRLKDYLIGRNIYKEVLSLSYEDYIKHPNDERSRFVHLFQWNIGKFRKSMTYWANLNNDIIDVELEKDIDEIMRDVESLKNGATMQDILKGIQATVPDEFVPDEVLAKPSKGYMVLVDKSKTNSPKFVHKDYDEAFKEANRLAKIEVGCLVYVVEVLAKVKGEVVVTELID